MQTRVVMHCSTEDGLGTFSQINTGEELQQFVSTVFVRKKNHYNSPKTISDPIYHTLVLFFGHIG